MEFKKRKEPILTPDPSLKHERFCVYNPCAVKHKGKIYMIYRAEGKYDEYVSTLCLATSTDGINFRKYKKNPIIKPTRKEEKRGCEDPRITKIGDTFYLTYTAFEKANPGEKGKINLSLATSKDLIHWKKKGIIIKNYKSGIILPEKVNDEYLMFIGDTNIKVARSKDLLRWKLDKKPLMSVRSKKFDSKLVETGPPLIYDNNKILFIYNSADKLIRYHVGYCVLDRLNPCKIFKRCSEPILSPTEQFELYGKVNNVVFAEGLVEHKGKYFLYHGGADKCVGVAIANKKDVFKLIRNSQSY